MISTGIHAFECADTFYHTMQFLKPRDILHSAQVCKAWNEVAENRNGFWGLLSINEGIPLVCSDSGQPRNYKQDFRDLFPITISGQRLGRLFGEVVGGIPPIREEWFNALKEADPFEKEALKKQNFRFMVDPRFVLRTFDKDTPLALDEEGNLIEIDLAEQPDYIFPEGPVQILWSLRNIKVLFSYPLTGKANGPVFAFFHPRVLEQCNSCPSEEGVWFLRRQVANISRGQPYPTQEEQMQKEGFGVVPLRIRIVFDAVEIFEKGTCPDDQDTYARTPTTVRYGNTDYPSTIGGFALRGGADVDYDYCDDDEDIGVVPGVPAEVRAAIGPRLLGT